MGLTDGAVVCIICRVLKQIVDPTWTDVESLEQAIR